MTHQPLRVILCCLPEQGSTETEEIVEELKERDREERGTGMKVKKGKQKVQEVPQSQAAALPKYLEEEETDKTKQAQIEQMYEKH